MPKICEDWLRLVDSYVYSASQIHEIYQVLPSSVDFKASKGLSNPLSYTALGKCSFISNKGAVNISNYCKAQKIFYDRPVKKFPNFSNCVLCVDFFWSMILGYKSFSLEKCTARCLWILVLADCSCYHTAVIIHIGRWWWLNIVDENCLLARDLGMNE